MSHAPVRRNCCRSGNTQLPNPKGPPSPLVQLRIAAWTGDARDTRPKSEVGGHKNYFNQVPTSSKRQGRAVTLPQPDTSEVPAGLKLSFVMAGRGRPWLTRGRATVFSYAADARIISSAAARADYCLDSGDSERSLGVTRSSIGTHVFLYTHRRAGRVLDVSGSL